MPPVVSKKVEVPVVGEAVEVVEAVVEAAPVVEAVAEAAPAAPEAAADSDKKE